MSYIRKIKKNGKTYLAEVEGKRINGKVVQKHIRYIGKEVDEKKVISISSDDLQVNEVKVYGPLLVLDSISKKLELQNMLGSYSNEILSMVYAHCLNYQSLNNMPEWFERTDLNNILDLDGLTEYRLLTSLDTLTESKIESIQRNVFNVAKRKYKLSLRGMVYDVTNTYLYGKKCTIGKLGHSKEGKKDKPLIQVGLCVTQKEGVPVFHKTFDGNIADSKTLSGLVQEFSHYNLRSGLLVYDRGIPSGENLREVKKLGWNTLCGVPMNSKEKSTVREVINDGGIKNVSNMIPLEKRVFYIKKVDYSFNRVKGKLAICYNDRKRVEIQESRHREIQHAQKSLSKGKPIKACLEKYFTPSGRIRKNILESDEEIDGYFCLFCTKNIQNKEMIKLYFDKDRACKLFCVTAAKAFESLSDLQEGDVSGMCLRFKEPVNYFV